ncbi:reactivating factor for ethanolamine ammonia lyase [Roseivivax jejudonensis]|uniref:Reactivating factor for ethanolamine ammonia lyase n=1 Tax=Roseivivax jejudonensis TaxID=1529041 RepID=A0A1X6ZX62_9RHOB|nr:ethanolamine ammonia-lyase reactivating factor EutA [Roseivivax jejudonensis]SLN63929.1 reactivating factor for ethanolamine ammonia lyase [Roseivivax jejudonensis]
MNRAADIGDPEAGGRVFFSQAGRSLIEEDQLELTSVGVDIGSSTSHLLVSTLLLDRLDTRYVVVERNVRFESEILLTPYAEGNTIDAEALGAFIEAQYARAGITPEEIDTGALILTGVAARRANARAIGELFAAQAGTFVALSAGDGLETMMAAHGSGAVALSNRGGPVLNIDVGGGTTKIALCAGGDVVARTALDAGARLVAFDDAGRIARLEPFGRRHIADAGLDAGLGDPLAPEARRRVAEAMTGCIIDAAQGEDVDGFMRLPPLDAAESPRVVLSGGASEYLEGAAGPADDLGPELIAALAARLEAIAAEVVPARQRIRATVVGASQYSVQVSGSTIFLDPADALPLRNLPVVAPKLDLGPEIDPDAVAQAVTDALGRMEMGDGETPVAVALPWQGSALYGRLKALGAGLVRGLAPLIAAGHPLVLVIDGDVGGLLGMQIRTEEDVPGAIVSVDGIALSEFDFIDIGAVIRATGAAPVVVKSLLFPEA